ncbi:MAG: 7-cyano-7-deazaguanine synthase, partial [Gallicola sp.]|nr:7-cyano-7-deazaguanine synthase [Gallicola sp.]
RGKSDNGMNNIFIPGRNLLLAVMAAAKYVPNQIWLGALCGEIHKYATDKNLKFRDDLSDLLTYVMSPFIEECKIVYPFVDKNWGKLQIVEWAINNGLKDKVLASSSCMEPEAGNCGRCGVCVRRAGIFRQLGFDENYNVEPFEAKENNKFLIDIIEAELNQDDSHYDSFRREEIVPSLIKYYDETDLNVILERLMYND